MAREGVAATAEVEVADSEEEDSENIKLPLLHFCLSTQYINYSGDLTAKRRIWITPLPMKGFNMNIYVGNLYLEIAEGELRQEFTAFGEVRAVTIMNDKYIGSGQSRGHAFVEMPSQSEGKTAIAALNDKVLRRMTISFIEALPLSDKKGEGSCTTKKSI